VKNRTSKGLPIAGDTPDHPDARTDLEGWAAYAKERIDGRPVIVSVSGGKDSLAVGLLLKSAGIPFTCVHMATGHEHPLTDDYVANYLPTVLGPVEILRSELGTFEDLARRWRMFPSGNRRFCTDKLKLAPLKKYLKTLDDEPVHTVGVRAGESRARAKLPEWEWAKRLDCDVWRPLLHWSEGDVIDLIKTSGAMPNPLYLKFGARRVGCWPCIFVGKADIRRVADNDPERIEYLAALEREVVQLASDHYRDVKGGTFESLGHTPPTFFENPRKAKSVAESVAWSRTTYGGKQLDMFQPNYGNEGCMRWGLCDSGGDE